MDNETNNELEENETEDRSQDSLESNDTKEDNSSTVIDSTDPSDNVSSPPPQEPRKKRSLKHLFGKLNLYILCFGLILCVSIFVAVIAYIDNKGSSTSTNISSNSLSASTLAQLANTNATVGSTGQLLNVESSAVFAGQVLARQDLDVAGNLNVGGTLGLNNLSVAGTSQFGQAQINKTLSVAGDSNLQGQVTINNALQVSGAGNFSGALSTPQLTTTNLQLNGDLDLTHHISAGGTSPTKLNGNALGSGGTASISGSDTAGSIAINTGGSPAAGCFVTINFNAKFNTTPHVLVTPIGSAAGGLAYYVDRSSTDLSICDNTNPPANASFGFDYFVVD
jgi:cytoskeletal protein CcmA (bactofilin family)